MPLRIMDANEVSIQNIHINDPVSEELNELSAEDCSNLLQSLCFEEIDNVECFTFDSPMCYVCNGYFGSCFGDPTCEACHEFLYPEGGPDCQHILTLLESSDSDSGNDEPVEAEQTYSLQHYMYGIEEEEEEDDNEELQESGEVLDISTNNCLQDDTQDIPNEPIIVRESKINIDSLPPEVLMNVFEYLDEISLWSVSQVNERWKIIVKTLYRSEHWRQFTHARWPLLYVTHENQDFFNMYSAVIKSCNCLKCIRQMITQEDFDVDDSSWRKHRLRTELRAMRLDPLEGIYALPLDTFCCHWQASIQGPIGSPYEGGLFLLYVQIPQSYPMGPPVVRFLTKILHPNISRHGDVGIDCIHHNWSLALTISKVLISIQSLLTDPYCEVCMEPAVATLYLENRPCFEEQARIWTWKYAMHGLRQH